MDTFQKNKYRFSSTQPLILIGNDIVEARNEQVNQLVSELIKYKVLIRDLVNSEVDYSKRNELLTIAMFIINNFELYDAFVKNEDVPIDVLHRFTRVDKKFLQKYREYIVAYTLIFGNPIYKNIQDYVQIVENSIEDEEEKNKKEIIEYEEKIGVNGIVIGKNKKNAIILTSIGEFKKVKLNQDVINGEEVKANEKKTLKDFKIYISIVLIFLVVFSISMLYKYNNVVRTIVVETTSPIRLEINGFNRVLNITSSTEKGQLLVEETNLLDQKLDRAIYKIIEYANENEMVKSTGITVTVTGKELRYNSLPETEEYIYKKDLKVRFNNSGREHKFN